MNRLVQQAVLLVAAIAVLGLAARASDEAYTQQSPTSSSGRSSHQH